METQRWTTKNCTKAIKRNLKFNQSRYVIQYFFFYGLLCIISLRKKKNETQYHFFYFGLVLQKHEIETENNDKLLMTRECVYRFKLESWERTGMFARFGFIMMSSSTSNVISIYVR